MNILIITPRLCYGGAERVSVLLANALFNNGHSVSIISNLLEPISYEINAKIQTINFSSASKNKLTKYISAIGIIRKHLKKEHPDVIIGVMSTCSMLAKIASIGLNIPIIATEHDAFERPASAPFTAYYWFTKFVLNKLYNYVTVLTTPDKELIKHKLKNIHVMPNPLSFAPLNKVPAKENTILAVGRLEDWHNKGFDVLIKAWAKIAAKFPEWQLNIAGVGTKQEQNFLLNIAKNNGAEKQVCLLGFHKNLNEVLKLASIFVLSSRYEGFGLVLIEAMSQGCACIAADYKGRQAEILNNSTAGITIEPDNINAMSQALEQLIMSPEKRTELSLKALERSKDYETHNIVAKWETLLALTQQAKK